MNLVAAAFIQHRQHLVNYVNAWLRDEVQAEDIVQDAFLRLLEMQVGVRTESVKNLLFTTCRHLVCDYLRHRQIAERTNIYMYMREERIVADADQGVRVRDLKEHEWRVVSQLPNRQRRVYCLSRYEEKNVAEISVQLSISPRTVEAHLLAGRKAVRTRMKAFVS